MTKAAAPSEKRTGEILVSSGCSTTSSRSHRTLMLQISHAKTNILAGRPRIEADWAMAAAARMAESPPAHPTPCSSVLSVSGFNPSFWATKRSKPGLPALVHVTATMWVMSLGLFPDSRRAFLHACTVRSTPALRKNLSNSEIEGATERLQNGSSYALMVDRLWIRVVWLIVKSFLILDYGLCQRVSACHDRPVIFLPWSLKIVPPLNETFQFVGRELERRVLRP